jgi:hypothetical protein
MAAGKVAVTVAITVAITVGVMVVVTPAQAQVGVGLGVGSGIGQVGSGAWLRESRLAPAMRYDAPMGSLRLQASAIERSGSLVLDRAAVDGAVSSPALGPLRFSLTGQFRDARIDTAQIATVGSALSLKRRGTGAWVGATHDRAAAPQFQFGAWQVIRSAIVSMTARSRATSTSERRQILVFDSTFTDTGGWQPYGRWVDRSSMSRTRQWSDVESRIDWSVGRLTLNATVTRTSLQAHDSLTRSRVVMWGSLNTAVVVNHRVSLVAAVGTVPTGVRADASRSRFATIGLRFAPAALLREPLHPAVRPSASAFRVVPMEAGLYRMVLRSPGARTVELSGDFNHWKAVALAQTSPDVWEITLPLAPGTHRINVRINGDNWTAPPGIPSVNDEFNGRVGLLVVR